MHERRLALRALMPILFILLIFCPSPLFALPSQQATPPTEVQTTDTANLRSGPGTNFAKVGSVTAGQTVSIQGCNDACDWYQLESGAWIAAFLVKPVTSAAAAGSAPAATVQATGAATKTASTLIATPTVVATPPAADQAKGAQASGNGNLRSGPGTNYARVGSVQAGQALEITGQNAQGDWYQLADGNWIAGILVTNAPAGLAVVEAPAVELAAEPAAAQPAAAPQDDLQARIERWQEKVDFSTVYTCGHFEYRLTDIRRKKSVWLFNREYVAQGEWLMVFVEVKNISPGTSHFGQFSPRLIVLTKDGRTADSTGDSKASGFASWMFSHGRFYEDINPGKTLGLVEAYDLPLEPDLILGFALLDCSDSLLSLGMWSNVPQSVK